MTEPRVEHRTGGSNLWGTPRAFAHRLVTTLRLPPIALDLAAEESTALAPRWFGPGGEHVDALAIDCERVSGTRWLNPPYSRQCCVCPDRVWKKKADDGVGCSARKHRSSNIDRWMAKCGHVGARPDAQASPIVALVPASTGTAWWHTAMATVSVVLLVSGRLRFLTDADEHGALKASGTGAPFDSAVLVWAGPRAGVPVWGAVSASGDLVDDRWGLGYLQNQPVWRR